MTDEPQECEAVRPLTGVLEHARDPALLVDPRGVVCGANEAARTRWPQFTSGTGVNVLELVDATSRDALAAVVESPADPNDVPRRLESIVLRGVGTVDRCTVHVSVSSEGAGPAVAPTRTVLFVPLDRGSHPPPEVDFELERRRFETFFHNASDALFIHDRTGTILDANEVALRLFEYSLPELQARTIGSLHEGGSANARKNVDLSVGEVLVFDGTFATRRGEAFPVRIRVQKVLLGDQQVNVSTVTDTRREQMMRAQLLRAEQLEAVSRMAGALAHDFNNLLMVALTGAIELGESDTMSPELREIAEDVRAATEQASALAARLTGVARSHRPMTGTTDLSTHIPAIQRMLQTLAGDRTDLRFDIATSPMNIPLHESQVTQILTNLVANASHAVADGGIIKVTALDASHDGELCAILSVSDNGCGMSPETVSKIFEPLYTTKGGGGGTGLGLASVQSILEQQGGVVEVKSTEGEGTTFELMFPTIGSCARDLPVPTRSEHQGRALVVDDMPAVRGVLTRLLTRWGFDVTCAEDGQAGIEEIQAHPAGHFQLMITDMMMPRKSGSELTEAAWDHDATLPVIVLTAFSTEFLPRAPARRLLCLSKPVQPTRLHAGIERLLADPPTTPPRDTTASTTQPIRS